MTMKKTHYPHQPLYRPKEGLIDPNADPIADAHRNEMREKILELLQSLPEQQRQVMILRFGIEDGIPRTLREVGDAHGCTPENVRRYESNALRHLRYPHNRSRLTPFVIEPGSSEILEQLAVDLFFVGLPPELERDWQTLLSRGETFQYLPHGFEGSLIPCLKDLPSKEFSADTRRIRLGSLAADDAWHFHRLYRQNGFQPLVFDLSESPPSEDQELQIRQRKGRLFFRNVVSNLVHGHLTQMISALRPRGTDQSALYWKIYDVREHRKIERFYVPWMQADSSFKRFQESLRDFGVDVSFEKDNPASRWLVFKPFDFDGTAETR